VLDLDSLHDEFSVHHTSSFTAENGLPPHSNLGNGGTEHAVEAPESAEWLNTLLQQVVDEYRCKLRADENGLEGPKVVLRRIQAFANEMRPQALLGPITVHSINLGRSAPRLSNARISNTPANMREVEFDLTYTDTASISLSTSVLFNYPLPAFARLPLSLVISVELFSSTMSFTPPIPVATSKSLPVESDAFPALTLAIPPSSISLSLKITSTMGSRAQLADVPKLHELIENQVKKVISEKGSWKIVLPGLDATKAREKREESVYPEANDKDLTSSE